jgi:16S rRNA processing protein RimM
LAQNNKPQQTVKQGEVAEPMVVMGRIVGPFGVLGWIKALAFTEYVDGLLDYPVWWLGEGDGKWRQVKVSECRVHAKMLTAAIDQCSDRTAALRLKGLQIAIPRNQLPSLPKNGQDGYYWSDLISLEVINLQGECLGRVIGLLETGANDVLQVQDEKEGSTERLIPFTAQVIMKVDLTDCRLTVDWGIDY